MVKKPQCPSCRQNLEFNDAFYCLDCSNKLLARIMSLENTVQCLKHIIQDKDAMIEILIGRLPE